MDPLPLELLPCVLSFVPFRDLLRKARFVNRLWSREAGLVAFAKVRVTVSRNILRKLVVVAAGRPKTRIPFKRVLFNMDWEQGELGDMDIGALFNLVEFVLPLLADMRSVDLRLPFELESLEDEQLAILHKITGNNKLKKVGFTSVPPALSLQFPSHLSPSLRSLSIEESPDHLDLNLVLSILQHLPHLQHLEISVKNSHVNGEHLRTFLYASLAKQPQHFSMRSVSLEFSSHESASVDRFGILDFFCFLTPHLCDLAIFRVPRDVGELEPLDEARLPVLHYGYPDGIVFRHESKKSMMELWDCDKEELWDWDPEEPTPYHIEFGVSVDFALAMLARIPLSTLEQLQISAGGDHVSTSEMHPLILSELLCRMPNLEFLILDKVRLPSSTLGYADLQTKIFNNLILRSCVLDSPATLERALHHEFRSLKAIQLEGLQCDTWQWNPTMKLENPLVGVLSSFYAQHQRPDRSLRWLSLPVHLEHLSIAEFSENTNTSHVHIFLQSTDASIGPSVKVAWRIARGDLAPGQLRGLKTSSRNRYIILKEKYLDAFATGLKEQATLLAAGSEISLPKLPSSSVDWALHGLCRQFNATVYTCMSAKEIKFYKLFRNTTT